MNTLWRFALLYLFKRQIKECNNIIALLPEIQEAGTSNGVFKKCQLKDNNKRAREASKSLNSSGSIRFDNYFVCYQVSTVSVLTKFH